MDGETGWKLAAKLMTRLSSTGEREAALIHSSMYQKEGKGNPTKLETVLQKSCKEIATAWTHPGFHSYILD